MTYKKFVDVLKIMFLAAALIFIIVLISFGFSKRRELAKEANRWYTIPETAEIEINERVYTGIYDEESDRWVVECNGYAMLGSGDEVSHIFGEVVNGATDIFISHYRRLLDASSSNESMGNGKIYVTISYNESIKKSECFYGGDGLYAFHVVAPKYKTYAVENDSLDSAMELEKYFSLLPDESVTAPDRFDLYVNDELYMSAVINADTCSYRMVYPVEAKVCHDIFFEEINGNIMYDEFLIPDEEPTYRFVYTQGDTVTTYDALCIGDGTIWNDEGVFVSINSSETFYRLDVKDYSSIYAVMTTKGYYPFISNIEYSYSYNSITIEKTGYDDDFSYTLEYRFTEDGKAYTLDGIEFIEAENTGYASSLLFARFDSLYADLTDIAEYANVCTEDARLKSRFKGYIITYNKDNGDEISVTLSAGSDPDAQQYYIFVDGVFTHSYYCGEVDVESLISAIAEYDLYKFSILNADQFVKQNFTHADFSDVEILAREELADGERTGNKTTYVYTANEESAGDYSFECTLYTIGNNCFAEPCELTLNTDLFDLLDIDAVEPAACEALYANTFLKEDTAVLFDKRIAVHKGSVCYDYYFGEADEEQHSDDDYDYIVTINAKTGVCMDVFQAVNTY